MTQTCIPYHSAWQARCDTACHSAPAAERENPRMPPVKRAVRIRQKTYIAEWRKFRGYSQEKVAEMIGMSRENFSRLENAKISYNQDSIELLAEALNCEVADLLMRDPTDSQNIWSIWSNAQQGVRQTIETVAKSIYESSIAQEIVQSDLERVTEDSMRVLRDQPQSSDPSLIVRAPRNNLDDKIWIYAIGDTYLGIEASKVVGKPDGEVAKIMLDQYLDVKRRRDPDRKLASPTPVKRLGGAKA